jgi:hypothetical protein
MRNKISIKTKIYLDNLRKFLEISEIKKINKNHILLIQEYLLRYQEPKIFRDLLKDLINFKYVVKSAIKNMEIIYKEIVKSGRYEVSSLKDIIINLHLIIDKESSKKDDKDRVFDLMTEYNKILYDKLKGNSDLKNLVYGESTIILNILTYAFYKALGGKKAEEILKDSTARLLKNVKFVDSVRLIGKKA